MNASLIIFTALLAIGYGMLLIVLKGRQAIAQKGLEKKSTLLIALSGAAGLIGALLGFLQIRLFEDLGIGQGLSTALSLGVLTGIVLFMYFFFVKKEQGVSSSS